MKYIVEIERMVAPPFSKILSISGRINVDINLINARTFVEPFSQVLGSHFVYL